MSKQSILGRVAQLAKANINALLDQAEDPGKMLDQLIRDYTNNIAEAKDAVATTIGNLRLAQQDNAEDVKVAADWGRKAEAAAGKAEEMRQAGNAAEGDKFDELAKVALGKQVALEQQSSSAAPGIKSQEEIVDQLKSGLTKMEEKLADLKAKRDQLVARSKTAHAQNTMQDAVSSINVLDPTSELSRFEDKVRREEAKAAGKQELAASTLDSQFEELDKLADNSEIEARFAKLKAKAGAH